jgi:hypothetical protein
MSSDEPIDDSQRADEDDDRVDLPNWLRDTRDDGGEPAARAFQYSIASLLWLMTACGAYFYLERTHGWQFGIHALAAIGLMFGVGLPVTFFILWALHRLLDTGLWLGLLLLGLAIAGIVLAALLLFPGF